MQGDSKGYVSWIVTLLCVGIVASLCAMWYAKGYKQGQINYSLGRVTYTVIEGKIIHIEGDAPDKEIDAHLSPIEEGVK